MIEDLKWAMTKLIDETEWMCNATKAAAKEKVYIVKMFPRKCMLWKGRAKDKGNNLK